MRLSPLQWFLGGCVVALMFIVGAVMVPAGRTAPSAQAASPLRLAIQPIPAPTAPTARTLATEPTCDPQVAIRAMLRGRATGLEYATRAIGLLQTVNSPGAIEVLGWAAEASEEGPPCFATFAYALHGNRHTARFKFWPDAPARLATKGQEADSLADLADITGLNGTWTPTQTQLELATMWRLGGGNQAEDTYLNPAVEGEILTRRRHCVPGNVDFAAGTAGTRTWIRLFRRERITRFRCIADEPWTTDIPRRGRVQPPYLFAAPGGA